MTRLVREFVAAHANPQLVGRQIARALIDHLSPRDTRWILIDDYHELVGSTEAEDFVDTFQQQAHRRFMIASRQRPSWATSKRVVYGEVAELGREQLAMDEVESSDLLGRAAQSRILAEQAEGWPAVLALAAAADLELAPVGALPSALHDYFAEELFQRASPDLQARLIDLSLLPRLPMFLRGHTNWQARSPRRRSLASFRLTNIPSFIRCFGSSFFRRWTISLLAAYVLRRQSALSRSGRVGRRAPSR